VFVSRVKSFDREQRARLALAYSFLIPKVKLAIQGQRFSDIKRGVTKILERLSLQDSTEVAQSIGWENKLVFEGKHKRALVKKNHKIILIGDSHGKGCAEKLTSHLGNSYEVTGYVEPSTGMEVITSSTREEIDHLTKDDVVIVCGVADNVAKNDSSKGLKYMTHFVQNRRYTYVMITITLNRFNLKESSSCINKEVNVFNRKLQETVMMFNHKEVINMSFCRKHFTKHELHTNGMGKEWFKHRIADAINKIFTYQNSVPISLDRKEKSLERSQLEKEETNKATSNQGSKT